LALACGWDLESLGSINQDGKRSLKGNLCYHNKEITRENKRRRQREISFDLIAQSK